MGGFPLPIAPPIIAVSALAATLRFLLLLVLVSWLDSEGLLDTDVFSADPTIRLTTRGVGQR